MTASDKSSSRDLTEPFQARVAPWMDATFGAMISGDKEERAHRFLEEALELVQSTGTTASEAHQLVDYVFGRPIGDTLQEVGGVMVTLAALCLAHAIDMHEAGETELARCWTKVEQIREKQAAKPKHSPLPEAVCSHAVSAFAAEVLAERRRQVEGEGWSLEHDNGYDTGELADAAACYAYHASLPDNLRASLKSKGEPHGWPFRRAFWKPTTRRRDLVKACALLIADGERLDRIEGARS